MTKYLPYRSAFAVTLSAAMLLPLAACGKGTSVDDPAGTPTSVATLTGEGKPQNTVPAPKSKLVPGTTPVASANAFVQASANLDGKAVCNLLVDTNGVLVSANSAKLQACATAANEGLKKNIGALAPRLRASIVKYAKVTGTKAVVTQADFSPQPPSPMTINLRKVGGKWYVVSK